ncbi:hypothetical protein Ddye_011518 [Dipteronia dyeriana]|uniref:Reverse transcriptase domain-containing protein n=1 Tax=Dipteronia dyeriana TaxID=168575 RepID=A0AAD9X2N4_9ROSI|nr:hypothetical protein Ddye_011518 [Dipteronia dyeriana]
MSMWVSREDFKHLVATTWNDTALYGCPMFILTQKPKSLKKALKDWNLATFGYVHDTVEQVHKNLAVIQDAISMNGTKVEGATSITQFRPIALANFNFKIITKILADRLGPIVNRVISHQQAAFIPSRHISNCIGESHFGICYIINSYQRYSLRFLSMWARG